MIICIGAIKCFYISVSQCTLFQDERSHKRGNRSQTNNSRREEEKKKVSEGSSRKSTANISDWQKKFTESIAVSNRSQQVHGSDGCSTPVSKKEVSQVSSSQKSRTDLRDRSAASSPTFNHNGKKMVEIWVTSSKKKSRADHRDGSLSSSPSRRSQDEDLIAGCSTPIKNTANNGHENAEFFTPRPMTQESVVTATQQSHDSQLITVGRGSSLSPSLGDSPLKNFLEVVKDKETIESVNRRSKRTGAAKVISV